MAFLTASISSWAAPVRITTIIEPSCLSPAAAVSSEAGRLRTNKKRRGLAAPASRARLPLLPGDYPAASYPLAIKPELGAHEGPDTSERPWACQRGAHAIRATISRVQKTTLYLPDDLKAAIEREARQRGVSEAHVIRQAIADAVVRPAPRGG